MFERFFGGNKSESPSTSENDLALSLEAKIRNQRASVLQAEEELEAARGTAQEGIWTQRLEQRRNELEELEAQNSDMAQAA